MTIITMDSVQSSQIHAIGYAAATNTLAIQFMSKGMPASLYHYANVTGEDFASFRDAESIGSHFYKHIKPFPEKYPYTRIETVEQGDQA